MQMYTISSLKRNGNLLSILMMTFILSVGLVTINADVFAAEPDTLQEYNIGPGPLSQVLSEFAGQASILLSADAQFTDGKTSSGLNGRFTVQEGLQAILAGSGLVAVTTGGNAYRLQVLSPSSSKTQMLANQNNSRGLGDLSTNDQVQLGSLVVVGATTNTDVTSEELELQQANDLADIFRHVPSVSVGGSLGIAQKVYLRGLEDTLLNVTVDGAPQTGTIFHHAGRVSIDPELLKKVDVQAGAGEATAGAGAIGGAIRFETKDPEDLLKEGQTLGGLIKGSVFTNKGKKASASIYGKLAEDYGAMASFVGINHEDMEDGNGDTIDATASNQRLGFLKFTGRPADDHDFEVSYEVREESGDFAQRPNWPVASWSPVYPMDEERKTVTFNHGYTPTDLLNLETTLYHTQRELEQDVFDRWGVYNAKLKSYGFDVRNISYIGQNEWIYGLEMRRDQVHGCLESGSCGDGDEDGEVRSLYVQDHLQVTDQLLASFGLRYDEYELEQLSSDTTIESSAFSPNVGIKYDINDNLQFSIGHARAMRGKEVGDAFTLGATIDPDLEPEKVRNSEVGIEYKDSSLAMKASAYHSTIDDVILDQLGAGNVYENAGEIVTKGFELQGAYRWDDVMLSASFSRNDARFNGDRVEAYEHNGLANSRGDTWNLEARYFYSSKLEFGWNVTHVRELNNIEVFQRATEIGWIGSTQTIDKPGYTIHDIYLRWLPLTDGSMTVDFAVQNLFDRYYHDHSSVGDYNHIPGWEGVTGQPEPGRDIRVTLAYQF